jgi:hypothetical protein
MKRRTAKAAEEATRPNRHEKLDWKLGQQRDPTNKNRLSLEPHCFPPAARAEQLPH